MRKVQIPVCRLPRDVRFYKIAFTLQLSIFTFVVLPITKPGFLGVSQFNDVIEICRRSTSVAMVRKISYFVTKFWRLPHCHAFKLILIYLLTYLLDSI